MAASEVLAKFAIWTAAAILAALAVVVFVQLLDRRIRTTGLLLDKKTRRFSPARLQLLVATIVGAGGYIQLVARTFGPESVQLCHTVTAAPCLPDVPPELLALMGSSHAIYLLRKAYLSLNGGVNGDKP